MSDCGSRLAKKRDGCHEEELVDSDIILDMSVCADVCVYMPAHVCSQIHVYTRTCTHACMHTYTRR